MPALISNLQSFHNSIGYQKARVEHKATAYYRNFVRAVLKDLALNTPQWTGNLAASWQVVVGANAHAEPNLEVEVNPGVQWDDLDHTSASFKGEPDAVMACLTWNEGAIQSIRWNSHVAIINTYPDLEAGEIKEEHLRHGNFIAGDIMAVSYVAQLYNHKNGRGIQIVPSSR